MKPVSETRRSIEESIYGSAGDGAVVHKSRIARSKPLQDKILLALRIVGMEALGERHARELRVVTQSFCFEKLPKSFDGVRLLFLTDFHLIKGACFYQKIVDTLAPLAYDYVLLGGDYWFDYAADNEDEEALASILRSLDPNAPVFSVLGNHDRYQTGFFLESLGVRVLINEHAALHRSGDTVYLAGVDDYRIYKASEVSEADAGIPGDSFKIMLSHSPQIYREVEDAGYDLCLCGHTHGGQFCLPGGYPLVRGAKDIPRWIVEGRWSYRNLAGYTSAGLGTSILPLRLFCRPHVVLIELNTPRR